MIAVRLISCLFVSSLVGASSGESITNSRTSLRQKQQQGREQYSADDSKNNNNSNANPPLVQVTVYSEAECPICRYFYTQVWPEVWNDNELRQVIDFNMVAWGNAYYATDTCGGSDRMYDANVRHCWYDTCIKDSVEPHDPNCFVGKPIYQHSQREGQIDIYETCVQQLYGIGDVSVGFTMCCEGDILDNASMTAQDIMTTCLKKVDSNGDPEVVESCFVVRGQLLEIQNAKITPDHPGVPYVIVNGKALDDARNVKSAICNELSSQEEEEQLPSACSSFKKR